MALNFAFSIIAVSMAFSAVGVVRTKNVVHAALFLVVVLAGAAALYILLAAEFVGWVQVLVYIGAILVLLLFGVMLTQAPMRAAVSLGNQQRFPAFVASMFLFGVLVTLLIDAFRREEIDLASPTKTEAIGDSIMRVYLVPFEVVSILLLAALVGAVVLARKD